VLFDRSKSALEFGDHQLEPLADSGIDHRGSAFCAGNLRKEHVNVRHGFHTFKNHIFAPPAPNVVVNFAHNARNIVAADIVDLRGSVTAVDPMRYSQSFVSATGLRVEAAPDLRRSQFSDRERAPALGRGRACRETPYRPGNFRNDGFDNSVGIDAGFCVSFVPLKLLLLQSFSFEGWLSTCYVPHQPVTFEKGIDAQCVKTASELNENRTVATAARKIRTLRIWSALFRRCECPNLDSSNGRAKAARVGLAIRPIKTARRQSRLKLESWRMDLGTTGL
jgi:hypothetical protein